MTADAQTILKNGEVVLNLTVAGIIQRQAFRLEREETAFGTIPFLVPKNHALAVNALMKACEMTKLPIKFGSQRFFPFGKALKDFVGL